MRSASSGGLRKHHTRRTGLYTMSVALFLFLSLLPSSTAQLVIQATIHKDETIGDTSAVFQGMNQTDTEEDAWHLIDLNEHAHAEYIACATSMERLGKRVPTPCTTIVRIALDGQFYITRLPDLGQMFQAYRPTDDDCKVKYPASCDGCCGTKVKSILNEFGLPGGKTCCAKVSNFGERMFHMGEEITSVPAKVTIAEGGFVWYRPPPKLFTGKLSSETRTETSFEFQAEFWQASKLPLSPATRNASGCVADRELCAVNSTKYSANCVSCTPIGTFNVTISVSRVRQLPRVGFGGYMLAFDGGDDFFLINLDKLPQYEFGLQFWFQQNKIRDGQSLFTWWTERGREWEVADTSNIFYYHFNNKTQRTGVGVNDGKWHHLAFSWRLHCRPETRQPGATYCIQGRPLPTSTLATDLLTADKCEVSRHCTHVEISLMVDGVKRAETNMPPFLPSMKGELVFGQSMQKPFKTAEVTLKDEFIAELEAKAENLATNLVLPFSDNQLQLMYSRLRSGYYNNTRIFVASLSKQTREAIFCEGEPWREPFAKYCDHLAPGGFRPGAALSGNIDEFRFYDYFRREWEVALGMNLVIISADVRPSGSTEYQVFTASPLEGNWSLRVYYDFDIKAADYVATSKDNIDNWPLTITDEHPFNGGYSYYPALLGGKTFQWAPLRVVSTAPIYGSRNLQIVVPDRTQPIPIDLLDLQFDPDTPPEDIFTRIEEKPRFGTLYLGADDCDNIQDVLTDSIVYRPVGCKGSIIGFRFTGALPGQPAISGCIIGAKISADDPTGSGSGMLATVADVSGTGEITRIDMVSMGRGYDWKNTLNNGATKVNISVDNASCLCLGQPGNVLGNFNPCLRPIISAGKADTSGADFAGFDLQTSGTYMGLPVFYYPTCTNGLCKGVKPRPCHWACHREVGWMTDIWHDVTQASSEKFMVGPFSIYDDKSFPKPTWSNSRHTIWYVPEHLREPDYYIEIDKKPVLQDTIKDAFLVRYYDYMPDNYRQDQEDDPPPFVHLWIHFVYEKLAMPLNTSIIWEESSPVLIQLSLVDFDRGTNVLNAPFSVHADLPKRGRLYQAVRISKEDNATEFERECICPTKPRFPQMDRAPENTKHESGTPLPGLRPCDISKIGFFCFKKGALISQNDTLVESTVDVVRRPGFQYSRDGMFVIYDMGIEESGTSQFYWRVKFPQGQIINATADIQVRSVNNRPVAMDTSLSTDEDTFKEVKLDAIDIDDFRKPAMYITDFPAHGTLYQCNATSSSAPCRLGERLSRVNETEPQWANVIVDPDGAIDDEKIAVLRVLDSDDPSVPRITRNNHNTSTVLAHGYGFGSYNFDPDEPDNFKKLCGTRGSIAADLLLEYPLFVTNIDFFYPIRSDTPFRILAERTRQFEHISYDYSVVGNVMQDFEVTDTKVTEEGYTYEEHKDGIHFVDSGKWQSEQSFSYKRSDCGQATGSYKELTQCQQIWDGTGFVRGEQRSTITEETERWFELFRGLPHHAQAQYDRMSPVFADTLFKTTRLRIEACGANMRVFGEDAPNFLENVHRVRVWGSKSQRAKGTITALDRRVVYVPDHNYVGTDSFTFRVVDHSGGALRSSSQFSLQRHWSPTVNVAITVRAKNDVPLATSVVASQVLGTAASEVVISTSGIHPGLNGATGSKVTRFDVEITTPAVRGRVLLSSGNPATASLVGFDGVLKYRTPSVIGCGQPYDFFEYRVKNAANGDDQYSRTFKVTIELRCQTGYTCDLPTFECKACPIGSYGDDSAIQNTCHLCPAGTYQGGTAAKSCTPCPPGSYNVRPGSGKCTLCPEGTYNGLEGQASCTSCPGGTHGPFSGLLKCKKCGPKHWTLTIGSFTCKDCPGNTRARLDASPGIEYCECEYGYYNVHGKSGVECLPCPPGAYCHGRNLLPVARTGYWTNRSIWTDDIEDIGTGNIAVGHAYFAPCSFRYLRGVCIGYPEVDVQEQEERCQYREHKVNQGPVRLDDMTSEGIDFNLSNCTLRDLSVPGEAAPEGLRSWIKRQDYPANAYCAVGYTGIICSECDVDYYRGLTGYCFKCSDLYKVPVANFLFFLFIMVLNGGFWVAMFIAACHRARSMYITISHFQLVAMLSRVGIPWPDYIQGPILFSALFNFAMDGLHWNCVGVRSAFEVRWVLEMFVPVVIVFGVYFYYYFRVREALANILHAEALQQEGGGEAAPSRATTAKPTTGKSVAASEAPNIAESAANALERASVTTQDDASVVSEKSGDESGSEQGSEIDEEEKERLKREALLAADANADRDVVMLLQPKEIRKLRDAGIWYTSMSLNVLFVMALSTLLIPFSCTQVSETLHYLDWFPGFSCDNPTHSNFIFFSFVLGFCWIIIFPCLMIYILRKGWFNELIRDRLFIRQFGWLFDCYEAKYFWWEIAVLFRKAFIIGITSMLTDNSYAQLLSLGVFLSIHLFWTFYMQPHIHERHNVMDIWLQIQYLLLIAFPLTNIVGNDGMKIITTETGVLNDNIRIKILEPEPDMDAIADKNINSNVISNMTFLVLISFTAIGNLFMVLYDLYESRVHAPEWAPYYWNAIFGCELWEWDEFVSSVLSQFDNFFTKIRDRKKVKPPSRPASRWAHRVMMMEGVAKLEDFASQDSVEAMLAAAVANTQEEEWARDKDSCAAYIRALDKRIFASEMYNSKAANLPLLERERNLAKKRLMQFLYEESGTVFKALYDQTGLNEQTLWDIQELERLRQEKAIIEAGEVEHRKYLSKENEEQKRRIGSVAQWKAKYEDETHKCEELKVQVKQARDALLLYHLEESDDSEEEKELDGYLQKSITTYIENKSVRDLVNEGRLEPQPIFQ